MSEKVDLEIVIPDLKNCSVLNDLEKTKELIQVLEYIDQPINTKLSSLLQLACRYGKDTAVVSYLLEHGANPNYLDIDGRDSLTYAKQNENLTVRQLCVDLLIPSIKSHLPQDPEVRKKQAFVLIKSEIQCHKDEEAERQRLFDELIEKCKELEVSNGK